MSNHARRRRVGTGSDSGYVPGLLPGLWQFLKECFTPATGRDRFPRRATATSRMVRAIKRGARH